MKQNMTTGAVCMAGMLAWAATASAEMLEDFEPGTSYAGPGTIQADPDNAGNQVLFLEAGEVATFIPPAFAGTVTMKIFDFGEITKAGNSRLDGPRWGIADVNKSTAVAIIDKPHLDAAVGYGNGIETARTTAWFSPRFFGEPRQVIALDDPATTEIFEGIGKWTTWAFEVAADGGVTISAPFHTNVYGTVDAMNTIWVTGGRPGRSFHGLLVDDITFEAPPTPASEYQAWASTFGLTDTNTTAAMTYDNEPDGMNNLQEYAFGGNPTNSDAAIFLPTARLLNAGTWEYVYRRQRDAAALELVYDLQYKAALGDASWISSAGAFETGTNTTDSTYDVVTNTIPLNMLPGVDKSFMKLEVTGSF